MRLFRSERFERRAPDTQLLFSPDSQHLALWDWCAEPLQAAATLISLTDDSADVPLYAPSSDAAWALRSLVWDVTGQRRAALWWQALESGAARADVIEVRSSVDGRVLWQVQDQGLSPELCVHSRGLSQFQLHLYADTLRLLDRRGLHQVHRSGLRTFEAYADPLALGLTALSGDVCALQNAPQPARHSPDGRFFFKHGLIHDRQAPQRAVTLPTVCVPPPASRCQGGPPEYGLWLPAQQRYLQDRDGQPYTYMTQQKAVNALMAERFLLEPVEVRLVPGSPVIREDFGVVPRWMLGEAAPTPPVVSEAGAAADLGALAAALKQRGLPVTAGRALVTAVDLPEGTVVAEVLQRPEGTCALMTAWRGLWPARWEVWLSAATDSARAQIEAALWEGHHQLHRVPPEQCLPQPDQSAVLDCTNDELLALLTHEDPEQAALADMVLWIRFQHLSAVLPHLQAPPEPDWNLFRMLWIEDQLPACVIRPVWRALPGWIQQELAGELSEQLGEDQEWSAWYGAA